MTFQDITTLEDARRWLAEQETVQHEHAHMLSLMFGEEIAPALEGKTFEGPLGC